MDWCGGDSVETPDQRSPLVALSFWLCLLVSAALYAVCALSPRVVEWETLQYRYAQHQLELLDVQNQIKQLNRVVNAMETDPDFSARMARSEFGSAATNAEQIPLPASLNYDPRRPQPGDQRRAAGLRWYVPVLQRIADDATLRVRTLGAAACLTLFAFLFLQERSLGILRTPARLMRRVASRYVLAEEPTRVRARRK